MHSEIPFIKNRTHRENFKIWNHLSRTTKTLLNITYQEQNWPKKHQNQKKACGTDSIRSKILKYNSPALHTAVLKVFNLLSSGCFPDTWNQGIITAICKSDYKLDPNNYRGSCVKVFTSILNDRIQTFLNEHNTLSKSQIWFLKNDHRTDHIYMLHTLINKHMFAHFVDFKKYSTLFGMMDYKLLLCYVEGKTYNIIKSMYSISKSSIKIGA